MFERRRLGCQLHTVRPVNDSDSYRASHTRSETHQKLAFEDKLVFITILNSTSRFHAFQHVAVADRTAIAGAAYLLSSWTLSPSLNHCHFIFYDNICPIDETFDSEAQLEL